MLRFFVFHYYLTFCKWTYIEKKLWVRWMGSKNNIQMCRRAIKTPPLHKAVGFRF